MARTQDKVRENRLRRAAQRQGLTLSKSPRRDPRATDYGTYTVTGPRGRKAAGLSLDQVEAMLLGVPEPKPKPVPESRAEAVPESVPETVPHPTLEKRAKLAARGGYVPKSPRKRG